MADLKQLQTYLDELLQHERPCPDIALNGLQLETSSREISKVAFAVDAGLDTVKIAVEQKAQLLIVHHGIFWGAVTPITKAHGAKIELLMKAGCSLYASHLPLDGNMTVGNGAQFARFLDLESIEPFCEYQGYCVGVKGKLAKPLTLEQISKKCEQINGYTSHIAMPFGTKTISSIAIVTGSGSFAISLCAGDASDSGSNDTIDLLISGEPKHEVYHMAKELRTNALFVGHYASETFGVRALQKVMEDTFKLQTTYIEDPSGI